MSGGRRATRREAIAIARRIRFLSRGVRRVEARTFSPTFPSGFTIGRSLCVDPATPICEEGESAPERLASRDRTRRTNRRRSCPGVSFGSVSRKIERAGEDRLRECLVGCTSIVPFEGYKKRVNPINSSLE